MGYCSANPSNLSMWAATEPRNRTWLVFNEPDVTGQCNITPDVAASRYITYYDQIKAGSNGSAKVLVGGTAFMPTTARGRAWWTTFLSQVQRPIEGIHFHAYGGACCHWPPQPEDWFTSRHCSPLDANCLTNELKDSYSFFQTQQKTTGKSIWVTEIGVLHNAYTHSEVRDGFMIPVMSWFTNAKSGQYPLFERLAWFSDYYAMYPSSNLLTYEGNPTDLGNQWKNY
jgi:hypothetical protein